MTAGDKAHSALIDEVNLAFTDLRQAADRLDEAVALQFGLNRTDLRCLGILYRRGRVTAGELADESGLTPGAITTVLDRMERGGYANRVADPDDRRRVLVISTAATRDVGARVYGEVEVAGRAQLEGSSVEKLIVIRDYLRTTREMYERQAGRFAGHSQTPAGAASGAESPDTSAPLDGVLAGRLEFNKGAAKVLIRGDASLDGLYRAHFEGPVPEVFVRGGTVTVQQRRRFRPFEWGAGTSEIALNATIPWVITMRGGMWKLTADLRDLRLDSLDVAGGASDVQLSLPVPVGTVPIRVSGGASKITLSRPPGVPIRADVNGGASQMTFDRRRLGGVGGRNRVESPEFEAATDRYEFRFTGGASQVIIDTI
jgi:DNA-binding MarR family transcriptional regulator